MKTELDLVESKLNSLLRFAGDLSQRTQETDFLEHLQQLQTFVQRLKLALKDLLRKGTDGQAKYALYSQQLMIYQQLLDHEEGILTELLSETELWTDPRKLLSIETIQTVSKQLQAMIGDQTTVQRQATTVNEVTEALLDSVENANYFR